ncbi:MAG: hypothetical protein J6T13_07565 [Bacteroidales bacterium]|nr:hypothetical protein [Bacteroidales bacterium]
MFLSVFVGGSAAIGGGMVHVVTLRNMLGGAAVFAEQKLRNGARCARVTKMGDDILLCRIQDIPLNPHSEESPDFGEDSPILSFDTQSVKERQ